MASKKELARQRIAAKKRRKRAARICGYILAAMLLNGFLAETLYSSRLATPQNTITQTITMDNVVLARRYGRRRVRRYCYVISDQVRYLFVHSHYSDSDLHTMLQKGDSLTITYLSRSRLYGYGIKNHIVAATYNGTELSSVERYNDKNGMGSAIEEMILYFLATGLLSFILVCSEGFFMQWIRAGSAQRKLEAEQRHKANIAAKKAAKANRT